MEKLFYGPLWPLPTPLPHDSLISGLSDITETSEYQEAVAMDIIISASSGNTSDVYLVVRDASKTPQFSRLNNGTVVLSIPPGGSRNLVQASYGSNKYLLADLGIDPGATYNEFWVCAIMQ